jgi:hypothetical protein
MEDEPFNWFRGSFTQLPHSYSELDVPFVFKYPPNTGYYCCNHFWARLNQPPTPNIICAHNCYCRHYKSTACFFYSLAAHLPVQDVPPRVHTHLENFKKPVFIWTRTDGQVLKKVFSLYDNRNQTENLKCSEQKSENRPTLVYTHG